jgi:hypothetical protein
MVEAASRLPAAPRVTLDGSGSEILFPSITHYQKWSRVYGIPRPLRVVLGQAFRWWFWREESRRARIAAAIHQSTRAPLRRTDYYGEFTVEGVAYDLPRGTRRELEAIEAQTYDVLLRELGPLPRASTRCAGAAYSPTSHSCSRR